MAMDISKCAALIIGVIFLQYASGIPISFVIRGPRPPPPRSIIGLSSTLPKYRIPPFPEINPKKYADIIHVTPDPAPIIPRLPGQQVYYTSTSSPPPKSIIEPFPTLPKYRIPPWTEINANENTDINHVTPKSIKPLPFGLKVYTSTSSPYYDGSSTPLGDLMDLVYRNSSKFIIPTEKMTDLENIAVPAKITELRGTMGFSYNATPFDNATNGVATNVCLIKMKLLVFAVIQVGFLY